MSGLQSAGSFVNGAANAVIGGATAQIARHGGIDIGVARLLFAVSSATADMICPDWQ